MVCQRARNSDRWQSAAGIPPFDALSEDFSESLPKKKGRFKNALCHTPSLPLVSRKFFSFRLRDGCRNLRRAFASI